MVPHKCIASSLPHATWHGQSSLFRKSGLARPLMCPEHLLDQAMATGKSPARKSGKGTSWAEAFAGHCGGSKQGLLTISMLHL